MWLEGDIEVGSGGVFRTLLREGLLGEVAFE